MRKRLILTFTFGALLQVAMALSAFFTHGFSGQPEIIGTPHQINDSGANGLIWRRLGHETEFRFEGSLRYNEVDGATRTLATTSFRRGEFSPTISFRGPPLSNGIRGSMINLQADEVFERRSYGFPFPWANSKIVYKIGDSSNPVQSIRVLSGIYFVTDTMRMKSLLFDEAFVAYTTMQYFPSGIDIKNMLLGMHLSWILIYIVVCLGRFAIFSLRTKQRRCIYCGFDNSQAGSTCSECGKQSSNVARAAVFG